MCHVGRKKRTGRELKLSLEMGSYEMKDVMLNLMSDVNILPKKSWDVMGKPKLVWSPLQLHLEK